MMIGFQDVTISWAGTDYTVPAKEQLGLVALVEDAICAPGEASATLALLRAGGPSHVRLARAYGAALRYAGAKVTDDEVYLSIQGDFAEERADVATRLNMAILGLLSIVSPPVALKITAPDEPKKKQPASPKAKRA